MINIKDFSEQASQILAYLQVINTLQTLQTKLIQNLKCISY